MKNHNSLDSYDVTAIFLCNNSTMQRFNEAEPFVI